MKDPSASSRAGRRDSHHSHPHLAGSAHGHGHGPGHGHGHGHGKEKEKDLENRRVKGEISCAECRRLKLKCDRKVPCTSCIRRGCSPICPTGSLTAGSGTRFVLASTSSLHQQVQAMSTRIRQLEDALSISHAALGAPTSHPLLSEELLGVKSGVFGVGEEGREGEELDEKDGDSEEGNDIDDELEERFGMMSVSEDGEVRFLGRAANESLFTLVNDARNEDLNPHIENQPSNPSPIVNMETTRTESTPLDTQLAQSASCFPFVSPDFLSQASFPHPLPFNASFNAYFPPAPLPNFSPKATLLQTLESRLPSLLRAKELLKTYLTHMAWFCIPVGRAQVFEELVPLFYESPGFGFLRTQTQGPCNQALFRKRLEKDARTPTYTHRLALLYSLLAGGAAGDEGLPLGNSEAQNYHTLAASAMGLNSIFGSVFDGEVEEVFRVEHGVGRTSSPGSGNMFGDGEGREKEEMSRWKDERQYVRACGLETVQAIATFSMYEFCCGRRGSLEGAWKVMVCGLGLAGSIGLHRDPSLLSWSCNTSSSSSAQTSATIPKRLANRRRHLFWELFAMDKFRSLESGRPACFNLNEVDCAFPDSELEVRTASERAEGREDVDEDENYIKSNFFRWKHRMTKQVIAPIAEKLCAARPIKYSEVLELDRRIREFEALPGGLGQECNTDDAMGSATGADTGVGPAEAGREGSENGSEKLQRAQWKINCGVMREIALLYVHRSFFARAMLSNPLKPLSTPYASSALAAYASAITLLKIVRSYYTHYGSMALRQWLTWAHALTSAVIVGSVAVRGPVSYVSASAWKELDAAVELFKAAQKHPVCKRGLPLLLRLQSRSEQAFKNGRGMGDIRFVLAEGAREELKIMYGATTYLNGKRSPARARAKSKARVSTDEKVASSDASTRSSPEAGIPTMTQRDWSPVQLPEHEKTASDMAATDVEWSMFAPPPSKSMADPVGSSQTQIPMQAPPQRQRRSTAFDVQSSLFEESAFTRHIAGPTQGQTAGQPITQAQASFEGTGGQLSPTEPTDPAYVSALIEIEKANLAALARNLPGVFSFGAQPQPVTSQVGNVSPGVNGQVREGSPSDSYDSTAWLQALSSSVSGALNANSSPQHRQEQAIGSSNYTPSSAHTPASNPTAPQFAPSAFHHSNPTSSGATKQPTTQSTSASPFSNVNFSQYSPDIDMSLSDFHLNELLQPYLGPGIHWNGTGPSADEINALVDFNLVDGGEEMYIDEHGAKAMPNANANGVSEGWRNTWNECL